MIPVVLLLLLILQPEFPMRYRSGLCFSGMQETFILISFYSAVFVAMFYSIDWVAAGVRWVIEHNPVYLYIYIYVSVLCMGRDRNGCM